LIGTFLVTVIATDGALSTTQTFEVSSIDTVPVPTSIPAQTASKSGSPLQITLSATDAENDSVTYTAKAAGYSAAANLQRLDQLQAWALSRTME